ncbi:MAG: hypothetical protein GY708_00545 [Actinomycetia bacterium]|nr:hypothetical protein [Actinomycetes bacterium]MCP4959317.1 hypothetical protein [Actinomycetes bacterium]
MSPLWVVAALVLVVGSILIGRLAVACAALAVETETALAEAAEAIAVLGEDRLGLDQTVNQLGRRADAMGGPIKASKATANIARSWWRRARR